MITSNIKTASYGVYSPLGNTAQKAAKSSFSDLMELAGNTNASNDQKTTESSSQKTEEMKVTSEKTETKQTEAKVSAEDKTTASAKTEKPQVSQKDNAVPEEENLDMEKVAELAQILNVTPQQFLESMEKFGFDMEALADSQNLMKMIMDLKGLSGPQEILTNEELMGMFKQLSAELKEMTLAVSNEKEEVLSETFDEAAVETEEDASAVLKKQENGAETGTSEEAFEGSKEFTETTENYVNSQDMNPMQNSNNVQNMSDVLDRVQQLVGERVDTEMSKNIMQQVTEQIHLTNRADLTSMEMQLYPEHLGKISIQVVFKNGTLTAQIAAETEAARAALESQILTLKESFDHQGLKVEAVEVMVSTKGFERNEQGQSSEEQNGQSNSRKKNKNAILDLPAQEEFLPEEENDLQQALGYSVTYTA